MKSDFEQQKAALMNDIRAVLDDVEQLYRQGAERGGEEAETLGRQAREQLERAKAKLSLFEEQAAGTLKQTAQQADKLVQDKPYHALGLAALAGLVVGILLNRR